jgi:hypothetical protein
MLIKAPKNKGLIPVNKSINLQITRLNVVRLRG